MNVCQKENTWKSFPVIMGVNAFRGYLDELRHAKSQHQLIPKDNSKKSKRKRNRKKNNKEEIMEKNGHQFASALANIPTVCEICSSLMWLMEKIWVCKGCKLTCHKKCAAKIMVSCRDNSLLQQGKKVFGATLERLVNEEFKIPLVVEQLISAIELKGLYTEGLYRKSGGLFDTTILNAIFYFELQDLWSSKLESHK